MGSADKTLQTELKRQNAGGEQLRHARLRCADEGFTTCTNLRLGLSVQAKSSLNFRESLLLCAPPSYATRLLPVCIISWAPLEKKKEEKKTLQALYCLPALSKTSAGGAQVLFWNAFAVGLCGILGVLMLQLMTISTIVDEKLPLLLIKCPGPVHGLTCKIYSCAPI